MKKWELWSILLGTGAILVFIAAIAVIWGIENIPSINKQIPPGSSPIHVRITHPDNQTGWPLNATIPIQISAWGAEPITKVDLYINNTIYQSQVYLADQAQKEYESVMHWQPGEIGQYILVAKVMDATGGTGVSNAVLIESAAAIGSRSPIQFTPGDTLANIAVTQNISLEEIQLANPGIDPQLALPEDSQIFIPNPPVVVINPNQIPAYIPNGNPPPVSNPPTDDSTTKKWTFIHDFLFWMKTSNTNQTEPPEEQKNPNLPAGPDLYSDYYKNCEVYLRVQGLPDSSQTVYEDGYFIYRSRDGGPFERIVTLPAYKDSSGGDSSPWTYHDKGQYGLLTYYAASFNSQGENPGTPVSISMDEVGCQGPDPVSGINLNGDGDLVLPGGLDTAYLYIQINNSQAVRVPEGDRMFLPHSGQKFNLDTYLDSLVDTVQIADLQVHMEVWGWQSGSLVYVGDLDRTIHRTVLTVCSKEGEGACTAGGGGVWVREMNILSKDIKPLDQQQYELHWQTTSLSEADEICLNMAEAFNGPQMEDANPVLYHNCYYATKEGYVGGQEGTYLLDLGQILYPADKSSVPVYNGTGQDYYQYRDFDLKHEIGTPFDVALRAFPILDKHEVNDISNTVYMHYYTSAAPTELPALASNVPSMYDIEILEDTYAPPTYEVWGSWACVIVDSDPNNDYGGVNNTLCPLSYVECGVNVDCEDPGFWGTIAKAWDMIVDAINEVKSAIAGAIAGVIPYCSDSSLCQDAVRAGLDYGITAISGMPPNLPNSDELLTEGITEVIGAGLGEIVDPNAIQYVCGDACKAEIATQLQPYLQQAKSYYSQPGCFEPSGHYNMFPVCVQPPAIVHPAPGSYNFPGFVVVRVTRKSTPESLAATSDIQGYTLLRLTVDGENFNRSGTYTNSCFYKDGITQDQLPDKYNPESLANFDYNPVGDNPMYEPLYEKFEMVLPWLEPGQSVDVPISLNQIPTGHPEDCIATAHSQYLFYKGVTHMSAVEYCYSVGSSVDWVPCTNGGADYWHFDNPDSPNDVAEFFEGAGE